MLLELLLTCMWSKETNICCDVQNENYDDDEGYMDDDDGGDGEGIY